MDINRISELNNAYDELLECKMHKEKVRQLIFGGRVYITNMQQDTSVSLDNEYKKDFLHRIEEDIDSEIARLEKFIKEL